MRDRHTKSVPVPVLLSAEEVSEALTNAARAKTGHTAANHAVESAIYTGRSQHGFGLLRAGCARVIKSRQQ